MTLFRERKIVSLTPDELERRRHFITATDVAPLCGRSPWSNAADVFAAKVYGQNSITNDAMRAGTLLEPSILAWAHEQLGGIVPGDWRVHENGINACSLDGMTVDGEPVEAKTSGIVGPGSPHQWGEAGTDEIPDYYLLQVHAQLVITGAARAWVPALLGGRGFVMFQVRANERIAAGILQISEQFWHEHVEQRVPPEGQLPSLETLRRLKREPGLTADIPVSLVAEYQAAKELEKAATAQATEAQQRLLDAIGPAEAGCWPGGLVTYYEQTRKAYHVAESTYRTLRVKADKRTMVKS